MRTIALSMLCATLFAAPAFAAKTTTQPNRIVKDAFAQKRGGTLDHAHEVYSFGHTKEFVTGWNGATTGPGAKGAFMMVVPLGKDRGKVLAGTKISRDLAGQGAALVRQHLVDKGLSGKIELGDHMKSSPNGGSRLKQHPFTRDSGFLRYTVTQKDGSQRRYLVHTNPKALASGNGALLGKVQADTDWYRAK